MGRTAVKQAVLGRFPQVKLASTSSVRAMRPMPKQIVRAPLLDLVRVARLFEWIEASIQATLRFWVAQGVLPAEVLEG
jgi:hypothetical protein